MFSKLIAHVVFHICGYRPTCYSHENDSRFTSASTPLTLIVRRAPVIVVTRSFRPSFTSVKLFPTITEAATRPMSYGVSQ